MSRRSRSSDAPADQPGPDRRPSVEQFLETVVRSGLLDREKLQAAIQTLPSEQAEDAVSVADHLVRTGKLSRFQARKLLAGIFRGLLFGPFQMLSLIGKGGMGKVFLARDSRDGMLRALKILPPKKARSKERLLARFLREMELSQKVIHPHLCQTFEAGQLHGVYYLAMEFIPGQTLSQLVMSQGPLPLGRAARLMAEVAAGLDHAHHLGLIHRDLKPSNIIITPHDHAKVLDLGLALMEGEQSDDPSVTGGQGYVVGTMDYIAPEQTYDPTAVDGRADLYSLGCTLYFALTGRPPFPGGTSLEKIRRHRKEEPEPLRSLLPEIPQGFAALVHQLMAKDPEGRLASAQEVEERLRSWTEGSPPQPLDRESDPDFVAAIETLRREEPPTDSSLTDIDLAGESADTVKISLEPAAGEKLTARQTLNWLLLLLGLAVTGAILATAVVWLVQWISG